MLSDAPWPRDNVVRNELVGITEARLRDPGLLQVDEGSCAAGGLEICQ